MGRKTCNAQKKCRSPSLFSLSPVFSCTLAPRKFYGSDDGRSWYGGRKEPKLQRKETFVVCGCNSKSVSRLPLPHFFSLSLFSRSLVLDVDEVVGSASQSRILKAPAFWSLGKTEGTEEMKEIIELRKANPQSCVFTLGFTSKLCL